MCCTSQTLTPPIPSLLTVSPRPGEPPQAVIMGDFNDANIIVAAVGDGGELAATGIIDFGDVVHTWRVNEVAIAMAYSMVGAWGQQEGNHLAAAAALLRGFRGGGSGGSSGSGGSGGSGGGSGCGTAAGGLSRTELGLLRVLVACRLACSYTMGCYAAAQDPTNPYLMLHAQPAARALEVWWTETSPKALVAALAIPLPLT